MSETRLDPASSGSGSYAGGVGSPGRAQIAGRTLRGDRWWVQPLITATLLVIWLLYALVRTSMQRYYFVEVPLPHPVLLPLRDRLCVPEARHLGTWLGELPPLVPFAFFVLPLLLGFRLTCYYYRKAYYRSFWLSPPACAVAEPHAKYTGETRFPLILQNIHRYFFYAAIVVSAMNTLDAFDGFHGKDGGVGMGLGTLIMLVNAASSGSTRRRATRAATSSVAGSSTSPSTRCATGPGPSSRASTPGTCSSPGPRSAR